MAFFVQFTVPRIEPPLVAAVGRTWCGGWPALFLSVCATTLAFGLGVGVEGVSGTSAYETRVPGDTIVLEARDFSGRPLQWYFEGRAIAGATTGTLTLPALSSAHAGNYFVRTTSPGIVRESDWFTLNVAPRVTDTAVDTSFTARGLGFGIDNFRIEHVYADGAMIVGGSQWIGHTIYQVQFGLRADGSGDNSVLRRYSSAQVVFPDGSYVPAGESRRVTLDGSFVSNFELPEELRGGPTISARAAGADRFLLVQGTTMLRVWSDGRHDRSFVYDGSQMDRLSFIAVDADGRVIVGGYPKGATAWRTIRLTASGVMDPGFQPIVGTVPRWRLPDGSIVTLRYEQQTSPLSVLERYTVNGTRDPTWDVSAWTRGSGIIAMDGEGRLYVALGYNMSPWGCGILRIKTVPTPEIDPSFWVDATGITTLIPSPNGDRLTFGANFSAVEGHATSRVARVDTTRVRAAAAPIVRAVTSTNVRRAGTRIAAMGATIGTAPFTYEWRALDGTPLPSRADSAELVFDSFQGEHVGRYQLRVTGAAGTTLGPIIDLRPAIPPVLANVSSRAYVGANDALMLGFAINGDYRSQQYLIRGVSPALAAWGVQPLMPDPVLTLRDSSGAIQAENDDWVDDPGLGAWTARVGAFALPVGSRDAAMRHFIYRLGNYTAMLTDKAGVPGIALIEAYDAASTATGFENISIRGVAGVGANALVAGFVVGDPLELGREVRVLVRAIGPSLAGFGVGNALADPVLTIYDASGRAIATNDDWSTTTDLPQLTDAMGIAGAFPLRDGSRDAALFLTLRPGAYTAHVASGTGVPGSALIEAYLVR